MEHFEGAAGPDTLLQDIVVRVDVLFPTIIATKPDKPYAILSLALSPCFRKCLAD